MNVKKRFELLRTARHTLALSYKADRGITLLVGFMVMLQAGVVPLVALSQRWVLESAGTGLVEKLWIAVAIGGAAYAMQVVGNRVAHNYRNDLSNRIHLAIEQEVAELTAGIAHVEHLENSDYINRLTALKRGTLALANSGWAIVVSFSSFISIGLSLWLLADLNPMFTLLAFSACLILPLTNRAKKFQREAQDNSIELLRKEGELHRIFLDANLSKEVWISGNGAQLNQQAEQCWQRALAIELRGALKGLVSESAGWFAFYAVFTAVLVKTALDLHSGAFNPGNLILLISLAGQLQQQIGSAAFSIAQLADGGHVTQHYYWLQSYAEQANKLGEPMSEHSHQGIEIQNLSFRYPNQKTPALTDIDLSIPWGTSVGIVGINGAGKTTLVKLLTGLLSAETGDVLVNGQALKNTNLKQWQDCCSGTFQDFLKLHGPLKESVAIGDLNNFDDEYKLMSAMQKAKVDDFIPTLADGIETNIGSTFQGVELSGGQWQRLAVARGLMKDRAKLAILDEPTAALDPLAEQRMFELFAEQTADLKRQGGIVVLVSHRFSTVKMADMIVVIDDGRIQEVGSHQQLMQENGKYAELYRTQAEAYA